MKTSYLSAFALVALSACGARPDATLNSNLVYVDDTFDACSASESVSLQGDTGTVTVAAGEEKFVKMPSYTTQTTWYCGGSRERFASSRPYNRVSVSRAGNGAIHWVMYVEQ